MDFAVGAGIDQPFVSVLEPDEVRRGAVFAAHLEDFATLFSRAHRASVHVDLVSDRRVHENHLRHFPG